MTSYSEQLDIIERHCKYGFIPSIPSSVAVVAADALLYLEGGSHPSETVKSYDMSWIPGIATIKEDHWEVVIGEIIDALHLEDLISDRTWGVLWDEDYPMYEEV